MTRLISLTILILVLAKSSQAEVTSQAPEAKEALGGKRVVLPQRIFATGTRRRMSKWSPALCPSSPFQSRTSQRKTLTPSMSCHQVGHRSAPSPSEAVHLAAQGAPSFVGREEEPCSTSSRMRGSLEWWRTLKNKDEEMVRERIQVEQKMEHVQ